MLIAKFPQNGQAEAALRREARLLRAVRPHVRMPVPDMDLHDGPPLFSLHPKLPGLRLERDDYLKLTRPQRERLAQDVAGFFRDLHAIPLEKKRMAGAEPVEWWDTSPETLQPVWETLPAQMREAARQAIAQYGQREERVEDQVYGFFDAHGWNMAFDHERGVLNGIYDFADSGIGPLAREFVQPSLIHPEFARLAIDAYEMLPGRAVDRREVFLLTAAQRLSEYAGALETGESLDLVRGFVAEWFTQHEIKG